MRHTYQIFPEKRLIVQRYLGSLTLADLRGSAERLWADRRYSPSYDVLSELSGARASLSLAAARQFGEFVAGHPMTSFGRQAAVLSTPVETALAFLVQRLMEGRAHVEIFSTWEAACSYLGVDLEPLG